ncbi:zf-HC2 domain-containing protein [Gleimia hominis]|uniref:Zf-HC2 domain-containing protein n=1 Tax=Gleimia hominis TaxID=595468 RepID=A0ABU3ID02_9ACTO|nr:zf-HC2 domain-containing protein [Gleimia hominis]MDT3767362.1 zf-HC2 domain-containing protein [Gleimia hominis]
MHKPCCCADLIDCLDAFTDEVLDEVRRAEIEQHVLNCPHCRAIIRRELRLRQRVRECNQYSAPVQLRAKVIMRLRTTHLQAR